MKILVTGATGFVGNQVISQLVTNYNHEIIATAIETESIVKERFFWFSKVKYVCQNLDENNINFFELFYKPDLVIHLSWAGLPNYQELFHIEKNLMSNYFFIKNLVENGIKEVVCIGTCFEYGLQNGCLKEDSVTEPSTMYGLAKDTLRKFIEKLQLKHQFGFNWLRLFYPYGKGQSPKSLLSQLELTIKNNEKVFNMSGGEQLRDYLTIEKVAEYIIKSSLQTNYNGIINICSGNPISVRKFVENYLEENNFKLELNLGYYPYPDYEPFAFWGDKTKLNLILEAKKNEG